MKIAVCSIPLRDLPDFEPPLGASRILDALAEGGYTDSYFYNLDLIRPTEEQILEHFRLERPNILGISAVVSTSYRYVKWMSHLLREHFPEMQQIVGGNLVASAHVLLAKCPIDLCVVGEGEEIIIELCKHYDRYGNFEVNDELRRIKGITFRKSGIKESLIAVAAGDVTFTGYAPKLTSNQIRQANISKYFGDPASLDQYLPDISKRADFLKDPRSHDPQRKGKKVASIVTSKGCVARCTFCHRWTKGYQMLGVDGIVEYIKYLKEEYNVGFLHLTEENFGSSIRHTEEICEKIKPLDVLWSASGMRVRSVRRDILKKMRDAGCTAVYFGIESGSEKMLQIMEKGATVDMNLEALREVQKAGLYTVIQLVLGMPGETNETVEQTAEFVRRAAAIFKDDFRLLTSVNYAQALPGTPLYEYNRLHGFIGDTLDEEEEYLLHISDEDAASPKHYINTTTERMSDVLIWRDRVTIPMVVQEMSYDSEIIKTAKYQRGDYFRFNRDHPIVQFLFRNIGDWVYAPMRLIRAYGRAGTIWGTLRILLEKPVGKAVEPVSLRRVMRDADIPISNIQPLRDGR